MQAFILALLIKAIEDPKIRAFALEFAEKLAEKLLPEIVATFPTFTAAVVKTVFDKLPNVAAIPEDVAHIAQDTAKHILDADPDLPILSNILDVSQLARKWLGI